MPDSKEPAPSAAAAPAAEASVAANRPASFAPFQFNHERRRDEFIKVACRCSADPVVDERVAIRNMATLKRSPGRPRR